MEKTTFRYSRTSQLYSSNSMKQRRSGYEPSDTETDWQDSPRQDQNHAVNGVFGPQNPEKNLDLPRNISPRRHGLKFSSRLDDSATKKDSKTSPINNKSPFRLRNEDGRTVSPMSVRRNVSPFSKSEHRRQVSPFKATTGNNNDEMTGSSKRRTRTPSREERGFSQYGETNKASDRSSHGRWATTAPRQRTGNNKQREKEGSNTRTPSVGEINEMVANIKISGRSPLLNAPNYETTGSISPGDIFFSRDQTGFRMQENDFPRPGKFTEIGTPIHQASTVNGSTEHNPSRTVMSSASRITMTTNSALRGQSTGKFSTESSKLSDTSRTTGSSFKRFTENRIKIQADGWFSCMRRGPCRTRKSPEKQYIDEASFIEKAFVVESLRQFWADKHQPASLDGFICHKQEAQILKQLVSHHNMPHILLKGPPGSGKRSLAIALLNEIFGDACRNISHDLRYIQVQEERAIQVAVPVTASAHHIELNVKLEANAKHALMNLVREISNSYVLMPEVSNVSLKPDYKVLVLYQVDKTAESIQHLIKWIMDCYTDACKLILCCEDDSDVLESVTNRCKVTKVDSPVTHEIMEVLIQIARKEEFELPMNFAARIAAKSKQNLRKAIMTLEACKAHNYPFSDDQPIPSGWEEILAELAAQILSDPSPDRLFSIRGKFQKLLVDFVHPKLILLKLTEQFLKGVEASSRRELYYWHAYYEKRIPTGSSALLKLEEFVAKFMSLHRKGSGGRHF